MDNYGSFVNNYEAYIDTTGGMEYALGRKQALKALGNVQGKTILDFGCGPGVNGRQLADMGANVIGIDISQEELAVARQRDPKSTYLHYDGITLIEALGGRKVDAILASFSFCTIPDNTLQPLLEQMYRLLPWEGGRLVIIEPNLEKALGTEYPGELKYHAQPGVQPGDHVHVTLGNGENAVELYHDIYRRHVDYRGLLGVSWFLQAQIKMKQPRPWGVNAIKWPKAITKPPFLLITADKERVR